MKEEAFRSWLNDRRNVNGDLLDARTDSSGLANYRTVERYEGDLDSHFDDDSLALPNSILCKT